MLKIVDAKVIVTCPGRNFVTLKIETADGIYGLGDATLNGRALAVVSYLRDHVAPCLIGRDAHRIEDIWQFLYRGADCILRTSARPWKPHLQSGSAHAAINAGER
jgi:mannonate dehydratase